MCIQLARGLKQSRLAQQKPGVQPRDKLVPATVPCGVLENENDSPTSRTMSAALLSGFQRVTLSVISADHDQIFMSPMRDLLYGVVVYCQHAAVNVREMNIRLAEAKEHHRSSKAVWPRQ